MKRILIVALVGVIAFSAVAFAGWKFGAKQGVDVGGAEFPFSAYVGYDFIALYIDTGPLSIAGDFVVTRDYDWSSSILSGIVAFETELVFSYLSSVDVTLSMDWDIDYAPLPDAINLDGWNGGIEVVGYVTNVLTLNAGAGLEYVRNLPWPALEGFKTTFFFGFDAEW